MIYSSIMVRILLLLLCLKGSLPSGKPSGQPTDQPSSQPTRIPSGQPTSMPSHPSVWLLIRYLLFNHHALLITSFIAQLLRLLTDVMNCVPKVTFNASILVVMDVTALKIVKLILLCLQVDNLVILVISIMPHLKVLKSIRKIVL